MLLIILQQFISQRKPPKGYYIYGDVGKFCNFMSWLSHKQISLIVLEINCSVLDINMKFLIYRHRKNYGYGHVL